MRHDTNSFFFVVAYFLAKKQHKFKIIKEKRKKEKRGNINFQCFVYSID